MKFNSWKLDNLIRYLIRLKSTELFDYHCTPMCFGEIHFYNGEDEAGNYMNASIDETERKQ